MLLCILIRCDPYIVFTYATVVTSTDFCPQEMEESKTWDQKLADTKIRQEARERELADMGVLSGACCVCSSAMRMAVLAQECRWGHTSACLIVRCPYRLIITQPPCRCVHLCFVSAGADREAQLERAKTVPHMTNLNEDPQLDQQIIYFIEDNKDTSVGRKDADNPKDIKLSGLSIQKDHAILRSTSGVITIEPASPGAKLFVNGTPITAPTALHHGSRVVFGTGAHVYKVVNPSEGAVEGYSIEGVGPEDTLDYSFAVGEMNKAQMQAMAAGEQQRRAEVGVVHGPTSTAGAQW